MKPSRQTHPSVLPAACLLILMFAAPAGAAEPVIFVAPVSNNTGRGEYDEAAAALTDGIMVLLAESQQAQVVERQRLTDILREQKLSVAALTDKDTLIRVGRLLTADRIVAGGVILAPKDPTGQPALTATLHTWNSADGRLIGSVTGSAPPGKLLELGLEVAGKLAKLLDVKLPAVDPAKLEKNPLAGLHYMRGLGFYHAGNYDRAVMEFFTTTGLDPMHDRAAFWRALCYVELKEYDHAIIELKDFLKFQHDSPLVPRAQELLTKYSPMWAGYVPALRAKEKAEQEKLKFPTRCVFPPAERRRAPAILLLPTADFVARYKAEPFAELIEQRLGAKVVLLPAGEAPTVGPLEGHKLIQQAEKLLEKLRKAHPGPERLLVLTEAALETDVDDRVISERWPAEGDPKVIVASCLWLHMNKPPDLRQVNPLAPPLPEHAEFYNFVLGCAGQLCGAGECPTFGCPVNPDWYLWDQRYYRSWLCDRCRAAMRKAAGLAAEPGAKPAPGSEPAPAGGK